MLDVLGRFPALTLEKREGGRYVVSGAISFHAEYNNRTIDDTYQIEIGIPNDYPASAPKVKEMEGRVPSDFHTYTCDASLCLGAPLAVRMAFLKRPTLLAYIENLVVPFFFSYSYKNTYGELPYGELPHGGEGLLEYYKDLLDVDTDVAALQLVGILADANYVGHMICPCGSMQRIRKCHGPKLIEIRAFQGPKEFLADAWSLLKYLESENENADYSRVMPRRIAEYRRRHPGAWPVTTPVR